jgi:hypothetical protein
MAHAGRSIRTTAPHARATRAACRLRNVFDLIVGILAGVRILPGVARQSLVEGIDGDRR